MAMVLGIDTGGTFTDSVIVDTEKKEILCKAKALTTKGDLSAGIKNSLNRLPKHLFNNLSFASLSTTLATNAIVEGRRCRTGAILLGKTINKELPVDLVAVVDGKINIKGQIQRDLDYEQLSDAAELFRENVDVIAISGFASTRNPVHENKAKKFIREKLGLPVVCAHELTGQLGFYERSVTCILNAGLLPIIKELIFSTRKCLDERKANLPIMVVKGDGSLMHESMAMDRPVETLLSGPAASIIGAQFLTGMEYAMILDMGGTTTDVADLTNGKVHIKEAGARIGGWSTRVRAADISTFGLGGDSHIYFDAHGTLRVGPKKVIPISTATDRYPSLADELKKYRRPEGYELCREKETDCFLFIRKQPGRIYSELEQKLLETLKAQPHSLFWLAEHFEKDAEQLNLTGLVEDGSVGRISFTPTDVLQAEGHLNLYDKRGAKIALTIMAERMNLSEVDFIIEVKRLIYRKMAAVCVQSASNFEGQEFDIRSEAAASYFLEKAFQPEAKGILQPKFTLTKPIIAIGAPVKAWLYQVGQYLNTTIVIPEHAEVANAVGAAVGRILEEVQVTIRHDAATRQYLIYTTKERLTCRALDEAKALAEKAAVNLVQRAAEEAGCGDSEVIIHQEDKYTKIFTSGAEHYVETVVKAIAVGKPKWSNLRKGTEI